MKKIKWITLITVAVLLLVSSCENARRITDDKGTLRGIKGVQVFIEPIVPDLQKAGITEDKFRTDVELKLKNAGVKVYTESERRKLPSSQANLLVISNFAMEHSEIKGFFSYAIEVCLMQFWSEPLGLDS